MPIENYNELDYIGIANNTEHIVLTIADDRNWDDVKTHLYDLQEKINKYLSFIENGEIFETYPEAVGRKIDIEINFKYPLPASCNDFLNKVYEIVKNAGFLLRWSVLS